MHRHSLRSKSIAALFIISSTSAVAAPPQVQPGSLNMFRDVRGANSVGVIPGDRLQYGANIIGGSAGVFLGATAGTGFISTAGPCSPLTVNPSFCSRSTGFDNSRLEPWQFQFSRGGEITTALGPSVIGVPLVPFPTSVRLSGGGLTPTIAWDVPNTFSPDGFRVQIFDKDRIQPDGTADIIYSADLSPTVDSFTLPGTAGLSTSGNYSINFQLIETRGHIAFTGSNAQIFSRSNSWFDFRPLTGAVPTDIALPTIDASGVYNFNVLGVGPDSVTFIDPEVAIGYHYAIGATDPNFQSLLLPDIGDGLYGLDYIDGTGTRSATVMHGEQFFFGAGGVSAFTVSGIETSAMLDPANGTAFITGLSFARTGAFTGTMTPITAFVTGVPEPQTWALMVAGLGVVGWAAKRRGRISNQV